jgi:hypothetical protein
VSWHDWRLYAALSCVPVGFLLALWLLDSDEKKRRRR